MSESGTRDGAAVRFPPPLVPLIGLAVGLLIQRFVWSLPFPVEGLARTAAGGVLAYGIYRWVGLKFLSKGWFNLDLVWALSLVLVGSISLLTLH